MKCIYVYDRIEKQQEAKRRKNGQVFTRLILQVYSLLQTLWMIINP